MAITTLKLASFQRDCGMNGLTPVSIIKPVTVK